MLYQDVLMLKVKLELYYMLVKKLKQEKYYIMIIMKEALIIIQNVLFDLIKFLFRLMIDL